MAENNIAKNTLFLYTRMIITILLSLYTARIVLQVLGVEDYGIFNVVGGVIASFSFLNTTLSGASSRYIMYELGKADNYRMRLVFNTSFNMHLLLSIFVLILAEIIGLWAVNYKLVIPSNRLFAANIVFQAIIISTSIQITQIPFNSDIIAHEHMDIYAYISMFEVCLKLISVIMLQWIKSIDKLILYASLQLIVSTIVAFLYRLYCYKKFKESHYIAKVDRKLFKSMLSFSGWDLYGNMCVVINSQGRTMILNHFFGPIVNAASGIAGQVGGMIVQFVTNFQIAVRPQIVKRYADKNYESMLGLCYTSAKYSYALIYFLAIPLIMEMHFVLQLWLGVVPKYVVTFTTLILIKNSIWGMFQPFSIGINAVGKMSKLSFAGSIYILSLFFTYPLLKLGLEPNVTYIIEIVIACIAGYISLFILKSYIQVFSFHYFHKKVLLKSILLTIFSFPIIYFVRNLMEESIYRFIIVCSICIVCNGVIIYFYIFDDEYRKKVKMYINKIKG